MSDSTPELLRAFFVTGLYGRYTLFTFFNVVREEMHYLEQM